MAFLNFSKIVLKSKYSYNFKTIFLTVYINCKFTQPNLTWIFPISRTWFCFSCSTDRDWVKLGWSYLSVIFGNICWFLYHILQENMGSHIWRLQHHKCIENYIFLIFNFMMYGYFMANTNGKVCRSSPKLLWRV